MVIDNHSHSHYIYEMQATMTSPVPAAPLFSAKTLSLVTFVHLLGLAAMIWFGLSLPVARPDMTMAAEVIERESTVVAPTPLPPKPTPAPAPTKPREPVTQRPVQVSPVVPTPTPPLPVSQEAAVKIEASRATSTQAAPPNTTPRAVSPEGAAAPSTAAVVLPNSDARELNNAKPPYPAISRRLGEQGKVLLKACINTAGGLDSLALVQTSGFDRLDQIALETVQKWKFIPAKRGTQAIAMCYQLPVKFTLE